MKLIAAELSLFSLDQTVLQRTERPQTKGLGITRNHHISKCRPPSCKPDMFLVGFNHFTPMPRDILKQRMHISNHINPWDYRGFREDSCLQPSCAPVAGHFHSQDDAVEADGPGAQYGPKSRESEEAMHQLEHQNFTASKFQLRCPLLPSQMSKLNLRLGSWCATIGPFAIRSSC